MVGKFTRRGIRDLSISNQAGKFNFINTAMWLILRSNWLEWIGITLAIWLYCNPFLNSQVSHVLAGLEADYFQAFDNVLMQVMLNQGTFPLWNPFLSTGLPFVAHPMLHVYNPFITIPILIFGEIEGFKIALFLGFVIAGLGMWWLGKELGFAWPVRVWLGLMFAFSGVPASKFIQGHYLMVFGFGWLPFFLAAIIATNRSRRSYYICLAALALAFLFFSGNAYYAYYTLWIIGIYAVITLFQVGLHPAKLFFNFGQLKILLCIGFLALGLIAIQLFPQLDYRSRYYKPTNSNLSDSQGMQDILLDFTSPEPFRPGALSNILRPEEFYAYIGWWPFAAFLLLPLAWKSKARRLIIFFLALILFTFIWVDVKDMPWHALFTKIAFLVQFRYPTRMVIVGSLALITTSGFGLDSLWKWAGSFSIRSGNQRLNLAAHYAVLFAIVVYLVLAISNLAVTSQHLLATVYRVEARATAAKWLREFDPGLFYMTAPDGWQGDTIRNNLLFLKGEDAIQDLSNHEPQISARYIKVMPKYQIIPNNFEALPNAVFLKSFGNLDIYKIPDSLPFAFVINDPTLTTSGTAPLRPDEVTPVFSFFIGKNSMQGSVTSDSNETLILLSTFNPDWRLTIDDISRKVYNASGYLAADVMPGTHFYKFIYQPTWFFVGLVVSTLTTFIVIFLLMSDVYKDWQLRKLLKKAGSTISSSQHTL